MRRAGRGPDGFVLAEALGRLWSAGVDAALPAVAGEAAPGGSRSGYAFERQRHWIDAGAPVPRRRRPRRKRRPPPRARPDWRPGPG
ncbi:hypothetical protein STENM223S_05898 [Streptomyces tendae]